MSGALTCHRFMACCAWNVSWKPGYPVNVPCDMQVRHRRHKGCWSRCSQWKNSRVALTLRGKQPGSLRTMHYSITAAALETYSVRGKGMKSRGIKRTLLAGRDRCMSSGIDEKEREWNWNSEWQDHSLQQWTESLQNMNADIRCQKIQTSVKLFFGKLLIQTCYWSYNTGSTWSNSLLVLEKDLSRAVGKQAQGHSAQKIRAEWCAFLGSNSNIIVRNISEASTKPSMIPEVLIPQRTSIFYSWTLQFNAK